ncbi:MAG: hypothetical protein IT473_12300 [Lysobacter sp.]|nr:hypothetical protein [Lysobacter sp.]
MKSLGFWLFVFGAGSFLLHQFGREFRLLSWVDNWGADVGMAIRIGLIVVGAALWLIGRKQEQAADTGASADSSADGTTKDSTNESTNG